MTRSPNEQNMLEHDIKHKQKTTQKNLHTFEPSHCLTNTCITLDVLMSYAFHVIIRVLVSIRKEIYFSAPLM